MMSSKCIQGASYLSCNDTSKEECSGQETTDYVYALQTSSSRGITQLSIKDLFCALSSLPERNIVYITLESGCLFG